MPPLYMNLKILYPPPPLPTFSMIFGDRNIYKQSGAVEACWAHNPEVRGSKPRSARFLFIFHEHHGAAHLAKVIYVYSCFKLGYENLNLP
jgi:hypothetical protein